MKTILTSLIWLTSKLHVNVDYQNLPNIMCLVESKYNLRSIKRKRHGFWSLTSEHMYYALSIYVIVKEKSRIVFTCLTKVCCFMHIRLIIVMHFYILYVKLLIAQYEKMKFVINWVHMLRWLQYVVILIHTISRIAIDVVHHFSQMLTSSLLKLSSESSFV